MDKTSIEESHVLRGVSKGLNAMENFELETMRNSQSEFALHANQSSMMDASGAMSSFNRDTVSSGLTNSKSEGGFNLNAALTNFDNFTAK